MTGKKFEKKIWFYLMLISAMPVLVLGVVSYVFSIGYAAEQLDASNDSALLQTVHGLRIGKYQAILWRGCGFQGVKALAGELRGKGRLCFCKSL